MATAWKMCMLVFTSACALQGFEKCDAVLYRHHVIVCRMHQESGGCAGHDMFFIAVKIQQFPGRRNADRSFPYAAGNGRVEK